MISTAWRPSGRALTRPVDANASSHSLNASTVPQQPYNACLALAHAKQAGLRCGGRRISVIGLAVASSTATPAEGVVRAGRARSTWRKLLDKAEGAEANAATLPAQPWQQSDHDASSSSAIGASAHVASSRLYSPRGLSPGRPHDRSSADGDVAGTAPIHSAAVATSASLARMRRLRAAMIALDSTRHGTAAGSNNSRTDPAAASGTSSPYDDEAWLFGCQISHGGTKPLHPAAARWHADANAAASAADAILSAYTSTSATTPAASTSATAKMNTNSIKADDENAKTLGSAALAAARLSLGVGGLSPGRQRRRGAGGLGTLPLPWEGAAWEDEEDGDDVDPYPVTSSSARSGSPWPRSRSPQSQPFANTTLHTYSSADEDDNDDYGYDDDTDAGDGVGAADGFGAGYGMSYERGFGRGDGYGNEAAYEGGSRRASDPWAASSSWGPAAATSGSDMALDGGDVASLMEQELTGVAVPMPTVTSARAAAASAASGMYPEAAAWSPPPPPPPPPPMPTAPPAAVANPTRADSPMFIVVRRDWRAEMQEAMGGPRKPTGVRSGSVGGGGADADEGADDSRVRRKPVALGPNSSRSPSNWRPQLEQEFRSLSGGGSYPSIRGGGGVGHSGGVRAGSSRAGSGSANGRSDSLGAKLTTQERAARDARLKGWRDQV